MNLISITSCGYFGTVIDKDIVYYCVDLPDIIVAEDLSPKLSTKKQD
jgi:hypothetical protein